MILILSYERDSHVPFISRRLDLLRAPYVWFNPALFPAEAEMRITYERDGLSGRVLYHNGREIDLSTVTAVWLRRAGHSRVGDQFANTPYHAGLIEHGDVFCAGLWETLDCLWVPGKPHADREAENKIVQLALAAKLGFRIPRTLIANSPDAFLEFYEACHGRVVTKPLAQGNGFWLYTEAVNRRMVKGYQTMRHGPVIVQEYVSKRLELRITVVDQQVFAAQVDSQSSPRTKDDWRHYGFGYQATWAPHRLPEDIEARCVRLVHSLELCYGAIDMILTPEGEYVFLEINPNGQWAFVEELTELPIADALVSMLVRGSAASVLERKDACAV